MLALYALFPFCRICEVPGEVEEHRDGSLTTLGFPKLNVDFRREEAVEEEVPGRDHSDYLR